MWWYAGSGAPSALVEDASIWQLPPSLPFYLVLYFILSTAVLHSIALYCTCLAALCCISFYQLLYCTVLHCISLYCIAPVLPPCTVFHIINCCVTQYCTCIANCILLHCTTNCCVAQYCIEFNCISLPCTLYFTLLKLAMHCISPI